MDIYDALLVQLAAFIFCTMRLRSLLRYFQQEEYDNSRFLKWWLSKRVFDMRATFGLIAAISLCYLLPQVPWQYFVAGGFVGLAIFEPDPTRMGKKQLVLTARAKTIWALASFITLFCHFILLLLAVQPCGFGTLIILIQALPLVMVFANYGLKPIELQNQQRYWEEAHKKVTGLKPITIGITGSFGKTSVKHILGHILQLQAPTLITPGSVNTPMGNTRIIRERLTADHKYFIAEMGAYAPGSIARLCDLTPPSHAVITAVGHAHYERFKTLENVADTKYELADAARAHSGKVIYNAQTLEFENARKRLEMDYSRENWIGCHLTPAQSPMSDEYQTQWQLTEVNQTVKGLTLKVKNGSRVHTFTAPLYGLHQAGNIVLSIATAHDALGISLNKIQTALKSCPQIPHRLEVKPHGQNGLLIDDSYNSNPKGFSNALTLLNQLAQENKGQRIVITPGMVELGADHDKLHYELGVKAAESADKVLLIQTKRVPTFKAGFLEQGKPENLIELSSFAEAQTWLADNLESTDVILIENDLPDLYESPPRF